MLVNLQKRYSVHSAPLLAFARSLKRRLRLGNREFNICLVDDDAIRQLNSAYRGKDKATDVLSFPWNETDGPHRPGPQPDSRRRASDGLKNFLGDVVISVETARRNAAAEGHATVNEIRWLILHGVLHLLGYDHERDTGEMIELELSVREQLGVAGHRGKEKSKVKSQKAKRKRQISKPDSFELLTFAFCILHFDLLDLPVMDLRLYVTIGWMAALAVLLALGSVASYLRLLMRRLTPVGVRKVFGPREHGRIRPNRERVGVSISALHGAAMHLFAVGLTGLLIWRRPEHLWEAIGTALLIVLAAVAIMDQLIPFLLVVRHDEPEVILERWESALRRVVICALPLTFPILISTTIARLLESTEPEPEPPSPQENLVELIATGEQEGLIEKGDRELLQSVVKFGDKVAREVMTPRPEIAAIEINSSIEDLRGLFRTKRMTRYPVYSGQMDHIEGFISVRDLMELSPEEQKRATLRELVRPVPFVPETKPIHDLLKELQQSTTQMAIVIDEYGSVSGLITIEDLVEQIVGEIRDEVEPHARDIIRESASTYILSGHAELAQVAGEVHVPLEGNDYSTVAGLVMNQLGHVPAAGEKVESHGLTFEVLEANQRTVLKVRMMVPPSQPAANSTHV